MQHIVLEFVDFQGSYMIALHKMRLIYSSELKVAKVEINVRIPETYWT